jgi:hypothetical protein
MTGVKCRHARIAMTLRERPIRRQLVASEEEPIVADSDRPRTTDELSRALDRLSHPTAKESVPLGFDPDDYPLR